MAARKYSHDRKYANAKFIIGENRTQFSQPGCELVCLVCFWLSQ